MSTTYQHEIQLLLQAQERQLPLFTFYGVQLTNVRWIEPGIFTAELVKGCYRLKCDYSQVENHVVFKAFHYGIGDHYSRQLLAHTFRFSRSALGNEQIAQEMDAEWWLPTYAKRQAQARTIEATLWYDCRQTNYGQRNKFR